MYHPKVLFQFLNLGIQPIIKCCAGLSVGGIYPYIVFQLFLPYTILLIVYLNVVHLDKKYNVLEAIR